MNRSLLACAVALIASACTASHHERHPVSNNVEHFEIGCDDVERAKRFYGTVFGWRFEPWGPPGFHLIETGAPEHPGIRGALGKRREPLSGTGFRSFICTITVDDVDATAKAVVAAGGKILIPKYEIPTVGSMIQFNDTEGNVVSAMRYLDRR